MKKIIVCILIVLSIFTLTGCGKEEKLSREKIPSNLKEITGEVKKANLNRDGNIVIDSSEVTDQVIYYSYEYEEVTIGLLTVRDSSGNIKVVVNTCQSCGGSPYAYFVQVGDKIQCQNCGNVFDIDKLDDLESDGCNPIAIEDRTDEDDKIIIGTDQLKKLKDKFLNWKGPKA